MALCDFGSLSSSHFAWSLAALALALAFAFRLLRRSPQDAPSGDAPACPPELLKDDLQVGEILNAYAEEVEMTVPFEIGDVRVSKLLVHPIKVRPAPNGRHERGKADTFYRAVEGRRSPKLAIHQRVSK